MDENPQKSAIRMSAAEDSVFVSALRAHVSRSRSPRLKHAPAHRAAAPCVRGLATHPNTATKARLLTYLEKPCSFFKMASDDGNNARSSGVRQWPDEAASSSADMLMVSASILLSPTSPVCRWRLTTVQEILSFLEPQRNKGNLPRSQN